MIMEDDKLKEVSEEWPRALRHELLSVQGVPMRWLIEARVHESELG